MVETIPLETQHNDPGTIPGELLRAEGVIDAIADYTERLAFNGNRPLAYAGALAGFAHFTGQVYRDCRDTRTNLIVFALAPSGVGKEIPRKVNRKLALALNAANGVREVFASGAGLEDTLKNHPELLYQTDEIHHLVQKLAEDDEAARQIMDMLLKVYSEANDHHTMRDRAKHGEIGEGGVIVEPHLTVFGTGIPDTFYAGFNDRMLEDGFAGRALVFEGDPLGEDNFGNHAEGVPPDVLRDLEAIRALGRVQVPETPEATALLRDCFRRASEAHRFFSAQGDRTAAALWARSKDKVGRLALLFAVSRSPLAAEIGYGDMEKAWNTVVFLTSKLLFRAQEFVADTLFARHCQKILRRIRRAPDQQMSYRDIFRNMNYDAKTLRKYLAHLTDREMLRVCEGPHGADIFKIAA